MEKKKRNRTIKVGESHLTQLLFSILFIAIFLLIMYVYFIINLRQGTNILYNSENYRFDATTLSEDNDLFIKDNWTFFPNLRTNDIRSYMSSIDYRKRPHAKNVTISENGWDNLGPNAEWENLVDGEVPEFRPFMNEGMRMVSGAYMATIKVSRETNTLYLDLGKLNGHAFIFCNGYPVGNTGDDTSFNIVPEYIGGYSSTAVQNRNDTIELIIIIYANEQTLHAGLNTTPALFHEKSNAILTTLPSAFLAAIAIMTVIAVIGGFLLRKTLSDPRSYTYFALSITSLFLYYVVNGNFLVLASPYRALMEFLFMTTSAIFGYCMITFLFTSYRTENGSKYGSLDCIIVSCAGIMILALAFLDSRLLSTSFKSTTLLIFVITITIMSVSKILLFYMDAPNSTIGLCTAISLFFTYFDMMFCNNLRSNCPLYAVFYLVALVSIMIYFVQRYLVQYSELKHSSEHLRLVVEEKTAHISMINRDLYNTNKKLLENEEARKNVMSNVSHDLRTPITAIRGYSELLLQSGSNLNEEQRSVYLQNIMKRSQQMERIVSDIVEISKMESSGFEFEFMDISMTELLDELYMLYSSDLRNGKKKLLLDLPDEDLLITKADPKRISRVFENLISNAINYTKEEAVIEIKAWRDNADKPFEEQKIHIEIKDNGIGIPPAELPHIFDRFYRAKNSGQNIKGTGLGLSIVKMIIDRHDAEINVESVLGEGTSFHVLMKPTY